MKDKSPIILALDFPDISSALSMIELTHEHISIYKVGLEYFLAHGREGVLKIKNEFPEIDIFLDLKLHDIPNTVSGAVASVADLKPRFLTVHASGGGVMVRAAAQDLPGTSITAVTVLTSLDDDELFAMGFSLKAQELAVKIGRRAMNHGATSIVCSPHEAALMRSELGQDLIIITPGVRPLGASQDDQNRVMTPQEAIKQGANYVVIGRPITQSADPASTAAEIRNSLS